MFKSLVLFSSLAALLAAVPAAKAQSGEAAGPNAAATQQAAPIVRSYPGSYPAGQYAAGQLRRNRLRNEISESQPIAGVWLRSESSAALNTISATPQHTEIRLDRGRLNVNVHHPAEHAEILVDLPGGQVSLFKDGLYTFNADTNTVRVLHGEAAAYPGPINATADTKPIKIKEDHQLSLVAVAGAKSGEIKSVEAYSYEIAVDLLPAGDHDRGYGEYGDGYRPYYAGGWGYPYAGYYPGYYGYGYPFGYGIGYYGGFGGGFRYRR